MKRALFQRAMAACAVLASMHAIGLPTAHAQASFPERPVHIVVPFLAGGSVDTVARLIGDKLGPRLGQQVVVENKAGAGGVVGADFVARARPDGHTLLLTPPGPLTTNAVLLKSMPYDARKAFDPVSLVAALPNVLLVGEKRGEWTAQKIIAEAKANPEKLTYGSQGIGTTGHLTGVLFDQQTGARLTHVAYKGFPPVLVDVIAGRVDMMFVDTANALPRVRNHSLIALAVASKSRVSSLPDVPTFAESGLKDFDYSITFGTVVASRTPVELRHQLAGHIGALTAQPDVRRRLESLGLIPHPILLEEFDRYLAREATQLARIIREGKVGS